MEPRLPGLAYHDSFAAAAASSALDDEVERDEEGEQSQRAVAMADNKRCAFANCPLRAASEVTPERAAMMCAAVTTLM
jgi:hypothetical protein